MLNRHRRSNSFVCMHLYIHRLWIENVSIRLVYICKLGKYIILTSTHQCSDSRQTPAARISAPGLPDGLFSNQKSQIWSNFGGPLNGKCWYILWPFVIFNGHCVYFTTFWSSLLSFGIIFQFVMFGPRKIWQPCSARWRPVHRGSLQPP
jgi:hypothetical protein